MDAEQDTEPELPRLPPPSTLPARLGRPTAPVFARLPSQENFAGTSSDPPVFSSDDVPAGSENYSARRKKTCRIGPWWESTAEHQQELPRKKRKTEALGRNFDSGVFMGKTREGSMPPSDVPSSELDLSQDAMGSASQPVFKNTSLEPKPLPDDNYTRWGPPRDLVSSFYCDTGDDSKTPDLSSGLSEDGRATGENDRNREALRGLHNSRRYRLRLSHSDTPSSTSHPALVVVEKAVENGVEDIDLSGQFVWHDQVQRDQDTPYRLEDRIFHPLHHLVKTRNLHDPDRYDSLVPDMRLWLSGNGLGSLPNEIYRLRNLTKLGLRQNKLRTLSPSIGHLERLQFLNVTGNRIAYLPWEITRLKDLTKLFVDGGHLYQPMVSDEVAGKMGKADFDTNKRKWPTMAVSAISWLDTAGIPVVKSPPRPSVTSSFDPGSQPSFKSSPPQHTGPRRPLSLSDMCLRAATSSPELSNLLHGPRSALLPVHIVALLTSTMHTEQTGGLRCSVCGRRFAVPRAEWLEWVYRRSSELVLPLLRTACSWQCADDFVATKPAVAAPGASLDKLHDGAIAAWGCGWGKQTTAAARPRPQLDPVANGR